MKVIAKDSVRFAHSGPSHNLLRPAIAELVSCGPLSGGLKPCCSCTKVHWTFSKGTHDPTHVRGWTCLRNHFHILQQKPAKCWLLFMSLFVEEFEFVDVEGAADAAGEVVAEVGGAG